MKRILFLGLTALLALTMCTPKTVQKAQQSTDQSFRKQPPAPLPAPKIEIGSHEQFQLGNGLKVIVVENHKLPQVSFQVFVDAPDVHEGEAAGFIDMAGTMLSRGTANRSKGQIDEAIDFMGASLSTSASGLFGTALTKHVDGLLDIMSDVLLHPSFPQEEFDKLKTQTLSGLAASKDDPNTIAENVGRVLRYGKDHPYGNVQTEESTGNATVELCQTYYQTYFKPNISYLVVVGDITAEELGMMLDDLLSGLPATGAPFPGKADVTIPGGVRVVEFDTPQSVAVFGQKGIERHDDDFFAAYVMNQILGAGGFESRLMQEVREKRGLTYGVYSYLVPRDLAAVYMGNVASANDRIAEAISVIRDEWARMAAGGVTEKELEDAKTYLTGAYPLRFDGNSRIAGILVGMQMDELPIDYIATRNDKVNAVTLADIRRVAAELLDPEGLLFVVVGRPEGLEGTQTN